MRCPFSVVGGTGPTARGTGGVLSAPLGSIGEGVAIASLDYAMLWCSHSYAMYAEGSKFIAWVVRVCYPLL